MARRHFSYARIGGTRDDAAGEAYDKVARMLALGYPGGPVMDRLAAHGDARAIKFAEPKMSGNIFDFSFSGIKTAVLYHLRRHPEMQPEIRCAQGGAGARGTRRGALLQAIECRDAGLGCELSTRRGGRSRNAHDCRGAAGWRAPDPGVGRRRGEPRAARHV